MAADLVEVQEASVGDGGGRGDSMAVSDYHIL
jgi:hypothetical protein